MSITSCGTRPHGSTDLLETTKLHDVVTSGVARVVLNSSVGPVTKLPGITDNAASISTTVSQHTGDEVGHQEALIDAVNRAKKQGAHFRIANCLDLSVDISGSIAIRSSYPQIPTWPAYILISEKPVPHTAARTITAKTQRISVYIAVHGGDANPIENPPTTRQHTNCSKEVAALLE